MEFFLCNKPKIAVKPTIHQNSVSNCLKNIFEKIFKSMIINVEFESWNYYIPHRYRLLGQTTKQPLNNFEPKKTWKYKDFEGWGLTLIAYK